MADLRNGSKIGGKAIENVVDSQTKANKALTDAKAYIDTKLSGIDPNATKVEDSTTNGNIKINGVENVVYTHPTSHPASIITQDVNNRFVTDTEKATWNGKLDSTANAVSASKLVTGRSISLTGDVTGSVTFDGSANVSIAATIADDSHNHTIANVEGLQTALDGKASSTHNHDTTYLKLSGGTLTGDVQVNGKGLFGAAAIGFADTNVDGKYWQFNEDSDGKFSLKLRNTADGSIDKIGLQLDPNGNIIIPNGGQSLHLKAGSNDHTYMAFFADSQALSTRSGYFGYGGTGGNQMSMVNEMANGNLYFAANGTGVANFGSPIQMQVSSNSGILGKGGMPIVVDHNNGNVTISATGGNLYLGYTNTTDITVQSNPIKDISYLYGQYGTMMRSTDEWLRINDDASHTGGTYFGTTIVRTDGELQVGGSGATFRASGSGVTWGNKHIVNSGSNANGYWVQYYDGTQICYGKKSWLLGGTQDYYAGDGNAFPAAFVGADAVSVTITGYQNNAGFSTGGVSQTFSIATSGTAWRFWLKFFSSMPAGTTMYCNWTAVGRWY